MKFNEEASNPMLVGAMNLLKDEDTPGHRQLFMQELAKAQLLSPVFVDPAPTVNEEGKTIVKEGAKVQFPMLNTKDGKKLFVLYTDKRCLDEAEQKEANSTPEMFRDNFAQVSIDEMGSMMAMPGPNGQTHPSDGVILNPFNESLIVGKEMAIGFFNRRLQAMKEQAEKAKQEQEDVGKVLQFPTRK